MHTVGHFSFYLSGEFIIFLLLKQLLYAKQ